MKNELGRSEISPPSPRRDPLLEKREKWVTPFVFSFAETQEQRAILARWRRGAPGLTDMSMTAKEHKLMIAMFSRINERVGIIADTLTSRGIWTGDDADAFSHALHFDQEKLKVFALQAFDDYHIFAANLDVDTDSEDQQSLPQHDLGG